MNKWPITKGVCEYLAKMYFLCPKISAVLHLRAWFEDGKFYLLVRLESRPSFYYLRSKNTALTLGQSKYKNGKSVMSVLSKIINSDGFPYWITVQQKQFRYTCRCRSYKFFNAQDYLGTMKCTDFQIKTKSPTGFNI